VQTPSPVAALAALALSAAPAAHAEALRSLEGVWVMDQAYEVRPDGGRTTTYGEHPLGLLMVDRTGRYSLQIFRPGRAAFASGDKARGAPDEYRQAVVGSSTHFGHVRIDRATHRLVFDIEAASFPNWEGQRQVRDYSFDHGLLRWAVPASASSSGVVAWSIWRRATANLSRPSHQDKGFRHVR
jgi:hypothetical protein